LGVHLIECNAYEHRVDVLWLDEELVDWENRDHILVCGAKFVLDGVVPLIVYYGAVVVPIG
ncbi:MAG: hypothetical protein ABEI52_04630, partial [Halobacteriaceae archaeon]